MMLLARGTDRDCRGGACVLAVTAGINTRHINTELASIEDWGTAWSYIKVFECCLKALHGDLT